MNKLYLLSLGLIFLSVTAFSQPSSTGSQLPADAANVPYWISMMQDPEANFYTTQEMFNTYWVNRPITRGCGWKVFKRWEYMMQSRISPDGTKPSPSDVYEKYTDYLSGTRSLSGNWTALGPSLIPLPGPAGYLGLGRLNNIAFHPTNLNTWYVAAPSGGMWMTMDGGQNWETHTDVLPTLGVSAIIVDHVNPAILFIGSGDRDAGDAPGLGVFKSTDGGLTWNASSTGMGNKTVGELLQHPANNQILLAATSGGIYRSTDHGATWTISQSGNFKDLDFKPNDPSIVFAAAGASFYRSADNGITWVQITAGLSGGQRGTIDVTAANPNYVYFLKSDNSSGFMGLYRSTDAGLTFTTRSTGPNILDWSCDGSGTGGQGWYDLALAADPLNAEIIYAGGVNVWKSVNGGTTWSINSHWYGGCSVAEVHADCHMLKFSPFDHKLYACNDGGVYQTSNGGTTWTDFTETMTIGQIYKLGQAQTVREKVINGFQDNGTYTYAGSDWLATGGGDGMECAFSYANAAWSYHTLYYGDVFRKYNNTNEVKIAGNGVHGINESGAWVTPFILAETNPENMFVGYKNIWRGKNIQSSAISWEKISDFGTGNNCAALEQSPANTDILYVSRYDNRFFISENVNAVSPVWTEMTSFLPASGYPTDIEAHPNDPNTVYITMANSVFKSTDKGITWTDISGTLPDISTNTIVYYKNAVEGLYVGTDASVYYKDETMSDWIPFCTGLPVNVRVTELDIYYDNDSISMDAIRASTYGRGLWSSDMYHATPDADFASDQTMIPPGCAVDFTDLSTGVPTEWNWTFEGGTPATSSEKNPQDITFSTPGTYFVKLVVSNEQGSDSITRLAYITVSNTILPDVDFTASAQVICANEMVQFTDETDYCPTTWLWEFDPSSVVYLLGTTNHSQNPAVIFTQNGSYTITLTATNANGSSVETKSGFIMNGGYPLPFTDDFQEGFESQNWTIENPDYQVTWDTITVPGTTAGNKAAWMNFFDYIYMYKRDRLISPLLDFTNYSNLVLTFRHAYAQRDVLKDSLIILVSDGCEEPFTRIFAVGPDGTPNAFVTHEPMMDPFYPQSNNDWCGGSYGVSCYQIDLNAFSGKANARIAFESYNRRGNNLFLDDISVTGIVSAPEQQQSDQDVNIFPNPSSGIVNITISRFSGEGQLILYDISGRIVFRKQLHEEGTIGYSGTHTEKMDISTIPTGIYMLRVITTQQSKAAKIIKE